MSFSETHYKHQVIVFNVGNDAISNLKSVEIPVSVPLMRIPAVHSSLTEVLASLSRLKVFKGDLCTSPYLEVRVLLDGPEPGLRHKIETALSGKNYRLAKIDVRYQSATTTSRKETAIDPEQLNQLQPIEVFYKVYQTKYNTAVPSALEKLFQQVAQEINELEV